MPLLCGIRTTGKYSLNLVYLFRLLIDYDSGQRASNRSRYTVQTGQRSREIRQSIISSHHNMKRTSSFPLRDPPLSVGNKSGKIPLMQPPSLKT